MEHSGSLATIQRSKRYSNLSGLETVSPDAFALAKAEASFLKTEMKKREKYFTEKTTTYKQTIAALIIKQEELMRRLDVEYQIRRALEAQKKTLESETYVLKRQIACDATKVDPRVKELEAQIKFLTDEQNKIRTLCYLAEKKLKSAEDRASKAENEVSRLKIELKVKDKAIQDKDLLK